MQIDKLHQLHPDILKISDLIHQAGGQLYLVGGCVRDFCLGITPKDLDFEVFGLAETKLQTLLSAHYHIEWVGKKFGVFIVKGLPFDIALPRTETKTGLKHNEFEVKVDPWLPVEKAAARRDFTINAMYLNPKTGEITDPFNGQLDLDKKILRHTSAQFSEDPLRVYRAMQFIARFDLTCEPETLALCRTMKGNHLPQERIWEEFKKLILQGFQIRKGLEFLREAGWLTYFPELEALVNCPQDPKWHPEGDVWTHTLLCMDAYAQHRLGDETEDLTVGLAVLCHDLGKPDTTLFQGDRIRSPRHDKVGATIAEHFLNRLTRDQFILKSIPPLVSEHMTPYQLYKDNASDSALRRLALRVSRVDRLLRVCRADREGRLIPWQPLPFPEGEWMNRRLKKLDLESKAPKPIIQGRDLIQMGLRPSPQFSEILDQLFHAQIEGAFETHEEGLVYLRQWLRKQE